MKNSFVHHLCIQTNTYLETLKFYTEKIDLNWYKKHPIFMDVILMRRSELGDFYIELQTGKHDELLSNGNTNSQGVSSFLFMGRRFTNRGYLV